jgi:hypothetical protein
MERFDNDLETVLCENHECIQQVVEKRTAIQEAVCQCIETLARERIFVYDLKPSNVVIRVDDDTGEVEVRIIDFGRDFCEWTGCMSDPARNTPHVDMLQRVCNGDEKKITHILFACMMVILSSTTTRTIYETRGHHRMDSELRASINPVSSAACELLNGMQGSNISHLRQLLRMDEVRGVLRHYHGRRNSGTHRTIRLAQGYEVFH